MPLGDFNVNEWQSHVGSRLFETKGTSKLEIYSSFKVIQVEIMSN